MRCSIVFNQELVEAVLGFLFREHHLVSLHHGMSKYMVRDPFGQGSPPGFVIAQGYSWLVRALLHSLRLGACLAGHMAAAIGLRSPGVYIVQ